MNLPSFFSRRSAAQLCATLALGGALLVPALVTASDNKTAPITITIDEASTGPKIDRHIFGHFAEHLGDGIYGGVWVGPKSKIPNTRGIRKDVVEALKDIKVPNVRWPGGCFADDYHWRDGIGKPSERRLRVNTSWAGRAEPNTFGAHEYFDFLSQIGSEAFISANIGSGTVQEAADWLEYLTASTKDSSLAQERAKNGHPEPYKVAFWGIGNEAWGCGGPMTAEEYLTELKRFANFSRNRNPAMPTQKVAVGPDGEGFAEYAEVVMKAWSTKVWAWDMNALSLHRYIRNGWPPNIAATGFNATQYAAVIHEALGMEDFIKANVAVMDKYDPERKIAILVDEWGAWYAPTAGTDPGYLVQANSQRDAIISALNFNIFIRHAERVRGANLAQMVNVLQAVILTDQEKMVLTPTYHAFRLYVPFQDAQRLGVAYNQGSYQQGNINVPQVDVVAAKGQDNRTWVAVTNVDPERALEVELVLKGRTIAKVDGETLEASAMDAVNSFQQPNTITPKPVNAALANGKLRLKLAPHSVTVVGLDI